MSSLVSELRAVEPAATGPNSALQVYAVNKSVAEFPTNEDLSTPEAAYATFNRLWADGDQAIWVRLTVKRISEQVTPKPRKRNVSEESVREWLDAEILEVRIAPGGWAAALARVPHPARTLIDVRYFEWENGRWLNAGNDRFGSLEAARRKFEAFCGYRQAERALAARPTIPNPEEHLRPFVAFLKREGADPQKFLLQALANHRVVILGEVHHRPRYWAFNSSLVKQPQFAREAGVIYLELPSNDQALVERFLAAPRYDPQPVIDLLRDNLWMGWPDQPMLDFFRTVWEVNQPLPPDQRLRVVLVDMARPWKEIQARDDWRKYDVDRNDFMARNVARDLRDHAADSRHALFIVGYLHALANLDDPAGQPVKSAGWHLRDTLGDTNVFAVFPHSPVLSNMGEVRGRLALGLFETAFAALTNRPMAFPLDHGPFGEMIFDASLDQPTTASYRQGYQAYLYLGPLEEESFSPLIPGFYTDDFVAELDRRHRILFGRGLVDAYGFSKLDGRNFIRWMSASWGQPRREWAAGRLGPMHAWQLGSDWEKQGTAAKQGSWPAETNAIRQTALRLFDALRAADYENPGDWRAFPAPDVDYRVHSDAPGWMRWVCQHFRTNPIVAVDLGEAKRQADGWPAVSYEVTLKDGATLEGTLPMRWNARAQQWYGVEGLDWHLRSSGPPSQP